MVNGVGLFGNSKLLLTRVHFARCLHSSIPAGRSPWPLPQVHWVSFFLLIFCLGLNYFIVTQIGNSLRQLLSPRAGRTSQRSDTQRLATIYEISLRYQNQDILRPSPARPVIDTTSQYVKGEEYLTRYVFDCTHSNTKCEIF